MAKDCFFCLYVLNFLCLVERRRSNEFLFLPKIKANHLTTLLDSFGTLFFLTYDCRRLFIMHPGKEP